MKSVFLIGNGFDLHHMLPTKYYDFMSVAEYLKSNNIFYPITVGKIFSNCKDNPNIVRCYESHKNVFDELAFESGDVDELLHAIQNNIWFNYFSKTLNRDLGWIDFENEISIVINTLNNIIENNRGTIYVPSDELLERFVLFNFNYFIEEFEKDRLEYQVDFNIKKQYLKEYPYNSGIYVADKKKIFEDLYKSLLDFSKALNIYFNCCVEALLNQASSDDIIKSQQMDLITLADVIVTFNYTNTLEKVYSSKNAYHIHGTVNGQNLVLGVNANDTKDPFIDDAELINFKKYYQREIFGTDIEYINWYREIIGNKNSYCVIVIGHSLDKTDKDVISSIFCHAKKIYITYYNDKCKSEYIANIVKLFGEDGLDKLKKEQHMQFVPLSEIEHLKEKIQSDDENWFV